MTIRNEAAERLVPGDMYCDNHSRCEGRDPFRHPGQFIWSLEDDRAAERRATVERIRERLMASPYLVHPDSLIMEALDEVAGSPFERRDSQTTRLSSAPAILDEEAKR